MIIFENININTKSILKNIDIHKPIPAIINIDIDSMFPKEKMIGSF